MDENGREMRGNWAKPLKPSIPERAKNVQQHATMPKRQEGGGEIDTYNKCRLAE